MNLDQQLTTARDLIARRDEIDAQLAALFQGRAQSRRSKRKCKHCGESGHRSDSCSQNETNAARPNGSSEAIEAATEDPFGSTTQPILDRLQN